MLFRSHGQYTEAHVDRCAHMCGAFGKQMDRLFAMAGLGSLDIRPPGKKPDWYMKDLLSFTEVYGADHLFAYMPGRKHSRFENYTRCNRITAPMALGEKLQNFSKDIDFWEGVKDLV